MIAVLDARPGLAGQLREKIAELAAHVRREPGCLSRSAQRMRSSTSAEAELYTAVIANAVRHSGQVRGRTAVRGQRRPRLPAWGAMINYDRTDEQTWSKHGPETAVDQGKGMLKTLAQPGCAARDLNPEPAD
jgi:hypothetical protein